MPFPAGWNAISLEGAIYWGLYTLAVFGGSPVVRACLKRFDLSTEDQGLERAGRIIGYLERFIAYPLASAGEYQALFLLFTGKSIARFRSPERAEYYLVGTLLSFSWAFALSLLAMFLKAVI